MHFNILLYTVLTAVILILKIIFSLGEVNRVDHSFCTRENGNDILETRMNINMQRNKRAINRLSPLPPFENRAYLRRV